MNKKFYISIGAIFLLYLTFVIVIKPKFFAIDTNQVYEIKDDKNEKIQNVNQNYEQEQNEKTFDYLTYEDEIIYSKIIENDKSAKMGESRELTVNELEKSFKLRKAYYAENLMPTNYLIYNKDNILPQYTFEKNEIIYPSEEMTDDELLQIIDFSASLTHFMQVDFNKTQNELKQNSNLVLSEEEIKNNMIEHIEKLYNISISDMNINFNFQDGFWNLFAEPKNIDTLRVQEKTYCIYTANTDDKTSEITEIDSYYSSRKLEDSKVPENLSDTENDLFSKKAKEILINNILYDKNIDDIVEVTKYSSNESKDTSIRVVFLVSENDYYNIELSYPSCAVIGYKHYTSDDNK